MSHNRPPVNRTALGTLVLLAGMIGIAGIGYPRLPTEMTIHWSLGAPYYGPETVTKHVGIFLIPIISLFTIAIFWLIPRLKVVPRSIENSWPYQGALMITMACYLLVQFLLIGINAGWL